MLTLSVDPFCVDVVVHTLVKAFFLRVFSDRLYFDDTATSCTSNADLEFRG